MTTFTPFLMFEGQAKAAMALYIDTFPGSEMVSAEYYGAGDSGPEGTVKVATFLLGGRTFMCSDSPIPHAFSFTPSSSIFVGCDSVEALEHAFGVLAEGGQVLMPVDDYGFSSRFGWVNDRFGVSWQLNLGATGG